jgi:cytoskeletal protein RodZ
MGQEVRSSPEAAALAGDEPGDASIGSYLARQRRLRGMSVDELANLTKVPRRSLERLEAGAFDRNPDGFVRGFVRTVAEALGLDPVDAVNRLLREPYEDEAVLIAKARFERRKLALRVALGLAALGLLFGLWRLALAVLSREAAEDPLVFRHDAVRELVDRAPAANEPEPAAEPAGD